MIGNVDGYPNNVTGRRLAEVVAEVVAASTGEDLSAPAVLERLGGAIREVLPGAGAEVVLDGDTRPIGAGDTGAEPSARRGASEVVEVPLQVDDEHFGTLTVFPDGAGPDPDTLRVLAILAEVSAACLRMVRTNHDLRTSLERTRLDALHDTLTGLPNRVLLLDRLEQALARSRRSERAVAALFVDLDRFKQVNDSYGHDVGDALLVAFAGRLRSLLRPGDTAARLGGDEFVVLCEDLRDPDEAEVVAGRLADAFEEPFSVAAGTMHVTASIGVVAAGSHHSPTSLLADADAAMYEAKRHGGRRYEVIDLRGGGTSTHETLAADLATAIGDGAIRLAYQPVAGTVDGLVAWAEVVLGWEHPTAGRLDHQQLQRLAERHGLAAELGRSVLERACADRRAWLAEGRTGGVAVKVSTVQLLSADVPATVADILTATGTDPAALTIELWEDVVTDFGGRVAPTLERLAALGVTLALDGFGTGRSSLGSLQDYRLSVVKFDSRLVAAIDDPATHATVFATTELAHLLGVAVVADGVSTEAQRREVTLVGCDYSQGPLFGLPVPPAELHALLTRS